MAQIYTIPDWINESATPGTKYTTLDGHVFQYLPDLNEVFRWVLVSRLKSKDDRDDFTAKTTYGVADGKFWYINSTPTMKLLSPKYWRGE